MDEPQYFICEGVRRCVAAREAGFRLMKATLVVAGRPDRALFVPLASLHSPKLSTSGSHDRYDDVRRALLTVQGRLKLTPIEIQPLGVPGQKRSIPLADVRLDP